jgi:hypothetical protein
VKVRHQTCLFRINMELDDKAIEAELYGDCLPIENPFLNETEKKINEFLDAEGLQYADPTENMHHFFQKNKEKVCRLKPSGKIEIQIISKQFNLSSSPILMRRQIKSKVSSPIRSTSSENDGEKLEQKENYQFKDYLSHFKNTKN